MSRVASPSLTIVSVLFGGEKVLEETLRSWRDALNASVEVVFVDHSPQPVGEALDLASWARYVWNPENPGFAAGVNAGVALAASDRIFLLNPDVFLHSAALDAVLALVDTGPYSVTLRTNEVDHTGIEYSWWGFCRDRSNSGRFLVGPSGGAAIFSTALVREEVPFPEHLFAWGEDAEWSLLLQTKGIQTVPLEGVVLNHVGGHSVASIEGQRLKTRLLVRNRIATFRRMFSTPTKVLIGLPFFAAIAANGLRKVQQRTFRSYVLGVRQGFSMDVRKGPVAQVNWSVWMKMTVPGRGGQ